MQMRVRVVKEEIIIFIQRALSLQIKFQKP